MRISIFIALILSSPLAGASCGDRPLITWQKEDGTSVGVVVTEEQQNKTPKWKMGAGDPPLSLTKAIDTALAWGTKNYKRYDSVQIHSISLNSIGCSAAKDKWYYLVHFAPVIDGNAIFGSGNMAAVLMDGTVVGPVPVKRDF